jgi:hypothetical protein
LRQRQLTPPMPCPKAIPAVSAVISPVPTRTAATLDHLAEAFCPKQGCAHRQFLEYLSLPRLFYFRGKVVDRVLRCPSAFRRLALFARPTVSVNSAPSTALPAPLPSPTHVPPRGHAQSKHARSRTTYDTMCPFIDHVGLSPNSLNWFNTLVDSARREKLRLPVGIVRRQN